MATSFQSAGAGHEEGKLVTTCKVTLESDGDGFAVTRSDLSLHAGVAGIKQAEFEKLAQQRRKAVQSPSCSVAKSR